MTGSAVVGLISGVGMLLLAVVVVIMLWRQQRVQWGWLGIGALMFVAMQIVKALTALGIGLQSWTPGWPLVFAGALLPGVWEEVGKWLPLRIRRPVSWDAVLSFGIGFGAIEAVMIGLQVAALAAVGSLAPGTLPAELQEQFAAPVTGFAMLGPALAIVERGAAISLHTAFAFMNAKAVLLRRASLFFGAVLLHTVVDVFAAYYQIINQSTWVIIGVEAILVLAGLAAIAYVRRSMAEPWPRELVS